MGHSPPTVKPEASRLVQFSHTRTYSLIPTIRSDFAAPIYGGWLGDSKVPDSALPLFILAAADDGISAGLPNLFKAWRDAGKSVELHIYSKGGHGFGMTKKGIPVDSWIERLYDWIKASGF